MNTSPEKAGAGDEANETRHLVQSESRVPPGTAPGAGEAGENAAIQVHTFTAKGATNVTVSQFVVDPSRIGPHEKLYIVHSGTSILVREVGGDFLPEPAIVAIAAIAGARVTEAHRVTEGAHEGGKAVLSATRGRVHRCVVAEAAALSEVGAELVSLRRGS